VTASYFCSWHLTGPNRVWLIDWFFHFEARSEKGEVCFMQCIWHIMRTRKRWTNLSQVALSLPSRLCYAVAWALMRSWQAMVYLFIGLMMAISYEFLHFQAHHRRPFTLVLLFKKYHLLHHHRPTLRFGVTSPVFDYSSDLITPPKQLEINCTQH